MLETLSQKPAARPHGRIDYPCEDWEMYLALWCALVALKVLLMIGIWRMAVRLGKSPSACLALSVLCASIVWVALYLNLREQRQPITR
jgi:hypothetical protein